MKKKTAEQCSIETEFCVVGGGMAGVCAALAAARSGADTVLVQDRPVLGGNASSEIRMWICGASGAENREAGILEELQLINLYHNPLRLYNVWDHLLYGRCLEEANLRVLLNSAVYGVNMEGSRIDSVRAWSLTRQRRLRISATLFADCSGDSVLRHSGAEYRTGREARSEFNESHAPESADGMTMGNSILIQTRQTGRHVPFRAPHWAYSYDDDTVPKRGMRPEGDNFWWLEIGGTRDTIADAESIRDELLKIAYGVWAYIKNHPDGRGHGWELDWIGSLPGKRENVRYVGEHILTQNDIEAGGRFNDIVAYGGWSMDDHHPEGINYPGAPTVFHPAPSPYGIPYRCLYSRNIENLFFAGRNISATHMALSSTRVMGTCALLGQAVGTAAAIASEKALSPGEVYESELAALQTALMEQDCYLPGRRREVPAPCSEADLSASSGDPNRLLNGIERDLNGEDNGWWGSDGDYVQYCWTDALVCRYARLVLDSDFSDNKRMLCRYPKGMEPAGMPSMLAREFSVEVRDAEGHWRAAAQVSDNHNRLHLIDLPDTDPVTGCRLRLGRSWGGGASHVFSFDVHGDRTGSKR